MKTLTQYGDGYQMLLMALPPGDNRDDALIELQKEQDRHQMRIWDILDLAGVFEGVPV